MNLEDQVMEIMRSVFGIEEISTDISQKNCERWDSLRHLTMASELEDAFDIELEPEEIAEMTDFSRVVSMINSKLK
jgi:acyl carrier protein